MSCNYKPSTRRYNAEHGVGVGQVLFLWFLFGLLWWFDIRVPEDIRLQKQFFKNLCLKYYNEWFQYILRSQSWKQKSFGLLSSAGHFRREKSVTISTTKGSCEPLICPLDPYVRTIRAKPSWLLWVVCRYTFSFSIALFSSFKTINEKQLFSIPSWKANEKQKSMKSKNILKI